MTRIDEVLKKHGDFVAEELIRRHCPGHFLINVPIYDRATEQIGDDGITIGCRGINCKECWNKEVETVGSLEPTKETNGSITMNMNEVETPKEIQRILSNMTENLNFLKDQIQLLEKYFSPVIGPEVNDVDVGSTKENPLTLLGRILDTNNESIKEITSKVKCMIARCQL